MARYTFAKFGSRIERAPAPYNTPLPLIEGDSSDSAHYWWTELASCSFGLTAAERTGDGEETKDEKTKPRPKMGSVTLSKKVDWGSADLFQKCCEAPEALKKKSDEDQAVGCLDEVVIEVCRESGIAGEGKFPFLIVTYKKVYVTKYGIEFSGPDPIETIEFKYEEAKFNYVATDPHTGGIKKSASTSTSDMINHPPPKPEPASATPGAAGGSALAGAGVVSAGVGAVAPGATGGGAAASGSPTDAAVSSNFPGYSGGAGSGVLP